MMNLENILQSNFSIIEDLARQKEIRRLKNKKFKNRYLNAILHRYIEALEEKYFNNNENIINEYFYMYEVYETLDEIDCMLRYNDSEWDHVDRLIESLENNIKIWECLHRPLNFDVNKIKSIICDLKIIQEYIEMEEFDAALEINNRIIENYFESKEEKYEANRSKKNKKRKSREDREAEYFELLYSYEYRTRKISKRDIAKKLGVSPAAVTQFCKLHKITW